MALSSPGGTLKSLIYSRWTLAFNSNGSTSLNSLPMNTGESSVPLTLLLVLVNATSRQPPPSIHCISWSYLLPQISLSFNSQETYMPSSGCTANKNDSNKEQQHVSAYVLWLIKWCFCLITLSLYRCTLFYLGEKPLTPLKPFIFRRKEVCRMSLKSFIF